ncbi:MAG: ribose 5-phosphate isomerase B [Clostridia bacterium]|jgi:ribose 5-phosphate isomerase B|nr:ribose 5-phosphate isomerase B [Clostridia bacterium]MBR2613085.1 ribose 5-phosphate isomerase B [Clostridia bacterium]
MKIVFGCDHAGFEIKDAVIAHIKEKGHEVIEVGTFSSASCHYPIYASAACEKILSGEAELGILICGTGIGMSIAANKHDGIRAACCSDCFSARLTREHNDANVLCLGQRVLGIGLALDLVDAFLDATYANSGNHVTRVAMLKDIEEGKL